MQDQHSTDSNEKLSFANNVYIWHAQQFRSPPSPLRRTRLAQQQHYRMPYALYLFHFGRNTLFMKLVLLLMNSGLILHSIAKSLTYKIKAETKSKRDSSVEGSNTDQYRQLSFQCD